ncbi:transporter substrate-binding domain-containing protein [Massilia sp. CCM 8733]|uniref:Transporter substrate-binding domain-containing protein n=1 Tax=Massilia mucilaginosa TaxID=2609282 RepID=A0ABX0P2G4_9BURK|nr:NrtA/SsuA/CpmA family ABC transporter substrate-binding protein [Massilia mucilaginosa]NHZ93050.1 transporter substrate-binding domain-containing protein [Massilia mucilaginosa]
MGETLPNSRKRYALAVLFALALAGVLVQWLRPFRPALSPPAAYTLTIASNSAYVGTCPVTVAVGSGYFEGEGVAASLQTHLTGKAALAAALSGRAGLATTADIPIMFAAMQKVPVSVVATFFKTEHDHGIVARRDRGIATLADLKGKRIGVSLGTSAHFVLDGFLSRQHLARGEVDVVDLKPEQFGAALAAGRVDAIATWEPFLDELQGALGRNGALFYAEDIYEIPYSLAGSRDFVAANPELMRRVLRALARGVRDCRDRPAHARAVMNAVLRADTDAWATRWQRLQFGMTLDQGLILALEDESRWAVANGLAAPGETPNFLDNMYLDALVHVAPAAVTVIR